MNRRDSGGIVDSEEISSALGYVTWAACGSTYRRLISFGKDRLHDLQETFGFFKRINSIPVYLNPRPISSSITAHYREECPCHEPTLSAFEVPPREG